MISLRQLAQELRVIRKKEDCSAPPLSGAVSFKSFYGRGEQTRADRCAYDGFRVEHPPTGEGGRENCRCDERARLGAEEVRPASGKDAEDAAPRSSAASALWRARKRGVVVCVAIAMGLLPSAAQAITIYSYSATPSTTQAGGHPNLSLSFSIGDFHNNAEHTNPEIPCACNNARNIDFHLPAGFIGNPHATPQCTSADFAREECPADSQVGVARPTVDIDQALLGPLATPVYNLVPRPNQAGLIGWLVPIFNSPVYHVLSARTGTDYGLDVLTHGVEQVLPLVHFEEELWGVPAEHYSSNSPPIPFLQNPTTCSGSLQSTLEILGYDDSQSEANAPWPPTTGCDSLTFNPSLSAQPTTTQTDSPSGLEVDLSVPQELSPETPSPSEIRAITVELPEGFTINPGAADGKAACTEAQAHLPFGPFASEAEATCPEYSKIGTTSVESSALPEPLPGSIYIGEPQPGNRYRIVLTANGFATHIKLLGTITPNPQTGRLTASFQSLPQSPLTEINMHFFGSERGLLATPTQCGTYAVHSTFTPWDESLPKQSATQFFKIDAGPGGIEAECPDPSRPFTPGFHSSTDANLAATHTPFWIELTRPDGDQDLSALTVTAPPGLSATLKGIPYCPQAQIQAAEAESYSGADELANPSCPAASLLGESVVGAGAGDHPVYFPGKVYLAGPYKGAPLSLAFITPAISGPYDLGNVVIREGLKINPETAQVTTTGAPLPQIFGGIPLRLRSVQVNLNRPDFTLTPTNCDPLSVGATASGTEGAQAQLSSYFQAANCANLAFAPKLTAAVSGSTKHGGFPALTTTVTYPGASSYANIARASVILPHQEFVENAHIRSPCLRPQFTAGKVPGEDCPPGSDIGFAKVETPLLEKPLEGPVYLRANGGERKLPDLVAALNGQIDVAPDFHVDSVGGRLRATLETSPDVPVSKFTLSLDGGNKGLMVNSIDLCSQTLHVAADITGQNGKTANQNPVLSTSCAKKKRKGHRAPRVHMNRRARG